MQATELESQLRLVLAPYGQVRVLRGANPSRGRLRRVRPAGVDKGAARRVLRALEAAGRPADFALVVGDDASDEPMFRELRKWQGDAAVPTATRARGVGAGLLRDRGQEAERRRVVRRRARQPRGTARGARACRTAARATTRRATSPPSASACAALRDDFPATRAATRTTARPRRRAGARRTWRGRSMPASARRRTSRGGGPWRARTRGSPSRTPSGRAAGGRERAHHRGGRRGERRRGHVLLGAPPPPHIEPTFIIHETRGPGSPERAKVAARTHEMNGMPTCVRAR